MRTLAEQAEAVARKDVSALELVEACLSRIGEVEAAFNAFTVVRADDAIERAHTLDAMEPTGPLHGVPVAVKDLFDVRGIATSGCCEAYLDRVARRDSAVVEALRAAGAVIVAKTNMHELAFGTTTQVSCFGGVRNPWDPKRVPGGSSGGSGVAVAAGAVAMAMGSDTGGSIRIPASLCGVTGLKPTHGAVSLRGALPMTPSFDTAGPIALTARDCLTVHQVIEGFDPDDPYSRTSVPADPPDSLRGVRIALPRAFQRTLHPETMAALTATAAQLEELGAVLDEVEGPDPDGLRDAVGALLVGEFAHHYRDLWDDERVSPPIRALLDLGRAVTAADYVASREAALRARRDFEWALTAADALLAPATPYPAPLIDQETVEVGETTASVEAGSLALCTLPVNAAGLPSVAFPVGLSSEGLPLGAQLIGRPWSEAFLCQLVATYQDATEHHLARPAP